MTFIVLCQPANVLNFKDGKPQLYWNVNGVGWSQVFDHVQATLHLSKGMTIDTTQNQPTCYSGTSGQKGADCYTDVPTGGNGNFKVEATQPLPAYGNLSFVLDLKDSGLHAPDWRDKVADYWRPVVAVAFLPLLTFIVAWSLWLKRGRDAKGTGTIIPQYDAPEGMTAIEVGTIVDFKTDNRDITATIIGLAIKKYIRIIETKSDGILKKGLNYELELLSTDFMKLTPDEQTLITSLFDEHVVGAKRQINAKANSTLAATAKSLSKQVEARLTAAQYFKADPLTAGKELYLVGSVMLFISFIVIQAVHGAGFVGLALAGAIAFIFARIMPARTAKGVAALEHIKGLKMYMEFAEADRIKTMQAPDARYADNHAEPTKTVDLFEKLLPYAIVLGVEKGWAKQFNDLYTTPPDWYSGNWTAFNAGYLVGSLSDGFQGAVGTSFAPPSSSGSSGFGGGGFSGGGGGGGGGGGW